jgi:hypothetical protein
LSSTCHKTPLADYEYSTQVMDSRKPSPGLYRAQASADTARMAVFGIFLTIMVSGATPEDERSFGVEGGG